MNCSWQKTTIVINLPTNNLGFFLDILSTLYSNASQKCDKCNIFITKYEHTFSNHIFIELCAPPSEKQQSIVDFDITLTLFIIPLHIPLY